MDIDDCAEIVAEEWLNSGLDIVVDPVELGLYLAIMYDRKWLEDRNLGDVTSTRVSRNGRKPGITTARDRACVRKASYPFHFF